MALLILTDEDEMRQIAIVCDKQMQYQFSLRLGHAPIVSKLLPEVLSKLLKAEDRLYLEVLICGVRDGEYQALLMNTGNGWQVPIRVSDAVLLHLVSGVPLFIEFTLMMRQGAPFSKEARGMALPVNTLSDTMLQKALEKAVADENYELASQLRDEQMKRQKHKEGNSNEGN